MDKIKLEYRIPKLKIIEYNNAEIELVPYLGFTQQVFLINAYLKEYFKETETPMVELDKYHYIDAEYSLFNYILQLLTNIDTGELPEDLYVDEDFFEKLTSHILNYKSFRCRLDNILNEAKEQMALEKSIGVAITNAIKKVEGFVVSLSSLDSKAIEELKNSSLEIVKKLEETSIFKTEVPSQVKKTRKKTE